MKPLQILLLGISILPLNVTGQGTPVLSFREGSICVTLQTKDAVTEEQAGKILNIYTHEAFIKHINQPVAGTYTSNSNGLSFKPSFSFMAGHQYHAVLTWQGKITELAFTIPAEKRSITYIEAVHPQADILPENMLRMYISFSNAMMPGEAYDHIKLLRGDGTVVEKAFLVIDQELWDAERKRLTLLFDPGRIKRGIQSQVDLGAPLQAEQLYQLVIDSAWRDVHGNALGNRYTKSFTVTDAQRSKLNLAQCKITSPVAGTKNDLLIEFDRPVDYVLALKSINIITAQNIRVEGEITFTASRYWRFAPAHPWTEDQYFVEINSLLEDVSGNNFNNVFDIDLSKESRIQTTESIRYVLPKTGIKLISRQ